SSSSSLRYLVILGSAGLVTLALSSIVISLSLIPLYLSSSSSSTTTLSSLAVPDYLLKKMIKKVSIDEFLKRRKKNLKIKKSKKIFIQEKI
ncbi:hypothetical protein BpHYR1_006188, partial [Brachionus plicatilis]